MFNLETVMKHTILVLHRTSGGTCSMACPQTLPLACSGMGLATRDYALTTIATHARCLTCGHMCFIYMLD